MPVLTVGVEVNAPAEAVWAAMTDWPAQSRWMLATTVRALDPQPGVGQRLQAWTGLGPLGVKDTMVVTEWDPPRRCVVAHTGRLVRGDGWFEVRDLGDRRTTLEWTERLRLPSHQLGRWGWAALGPLVRAGVAWSLQRFAGQVERAVRRQGQRAVRP
jgi:hypothetical protein